MAAGVQNIRLNTNDLYFGQNTGIDPAIAGIGIIHTWKADINAGLWLYSPNFFIGASSTKYHSSGFCF